VSRMSGRIRKSLHGGVSARMRWIVVFTAVLAISGKWKAQNDTGETIDFRGRCESVGLACEGVLAGIMRSQGGDGE
jgi:hypothetical protein